MAVSNYEDVPWLTREDCLRCGGTGQVMKHVAGRGGYVPCESCDNVPEYALPEEIPEDPVARYHDLGDELQERKEERTTWERLTEQRSKALGDLREFVGSDFVDDETATILRYLISQFAREVHENVDMARQQQYDLEGIRRERAQLRTLIDHADGLEVADDA